MNKIHDFCRRFCCNENPWKHWLRLQQEWQHSIHNLRIRVWKCHIQCSESTTKLVYVTQRDSRTEWMRRKENQRRKIETQVQCISSWQRLVIHQDSLYRSCRAHTHKWITLSDGKIKNFFFHFSVTPSSPKCTVFVFVFFSFCWDKRHTSPIIQSIGRNRRFCSIKIKIVFEDQVERSQTDGERKRANESVLLRTCEWVREKNV